MPEPVETFTFTEADLADAFARWMADCPQTADGRFADPAGTPADSARALLRYLAA